MNISSDTTAPDDVAPDAEMIAIYADVVFGYCDGWVPVRALAEKGAGDGPPHVPFIEADGTLAAKLALQATWASGVGMALFVAPGTVAAPGDARADSILQTQVVRFTNWLTEIDRLSGPIAAIWFEEVRRHAGTDASHIYGGLMATLTAWAELRGVPYEGVPVGTIKRHATGKGNADKEAMIAAVRARGFSPADDNEADAIALLLWAIQTNGGVA